MAGGGRARAAARFADELTARLSGLRDLSRTTPNKYRELEAWLADQLDVDAERVRTVYLSDLSQQYTARVGASLISEPLILVVLGSDDFEHPNPEGVSTVDRLARICSYVGRIHVIIIAEGAEGGPWEVPFIVGPILSEIFAQAQQLLPDAEPIGVVVSPL